MSADRHRPTHPTPDQLEAWADGLSSPAEIANLERHFAECEDCRQLAEDLRGFATLAADSPDWSAQEVDAALGRLRLLSLADELSAGAGSESGGPESAPVVPFERPSRRASPATPFPRRFSPAWAAAAVLFIAIGFGFAGERQLQLGRRERELQAAKGELAELRARRAAAALANPATVEAQPLDGPARGSADGASLASGATVVLREELQPFPAGDWRAEIESPDGRPELQVPGLRPLAGELQFLLLPGALAPGEHHLHLFLDGKPWPRAFLFVLNDG